LVVDTVLGPVLVELVGLVFEWERDDVVEILNPSCDVVMVGELLLEESEEGLSSEGGDWWWRRFIIEYILSFGFVLWFWNVCFFVYGREIY